MHDLLHIEICQKADSALLKGEIEGLVYEEILAEGKVDLDCVYYGEKCKNETLKTHVESFLCTYDDAEKHQIKIEGANIKFYTYRLTQEDVATETIQTDSEQLSAASHWILPAKEFHYLWENLFYDSEMKENLLHFVQSTMIFSDKNVNSTIISWNKVILLHGPPGTGKTSLCKAIAQKAAIRLGDRFTHGELIEINSHSLFSKWFSESGKLVMQLFNEIKTLLENPNALVCVLIDEIESLAHVRKSCANGIEPTDSIRVVNALLTQLDHIKRFPNVLILTTSNMTESIDLAFVDRADIKLLVGHPNVQCIYKIFSTCLKELMRADIIESQPIHELSYLKFVGYEETSCTKASIKLLELSQLSQGLSGRTLRRIPFLAHALHIQNPKCTLTQFLRAIYLTIEKQKEESENW